MENYLEKKVSSSVNAKLMSQPISVVMQPSSHPLWPNFTRRSFALPVSVSLGYQVHEDINMKMLDSEIGRISINLVSISALFISLFSSPWLTPPCPLATDYQGLLIFHLCTSSSMQLPLQLFVSSGNNW